MTQVFATYVITEGLLTASLAKIDSANVPGAPGISSMPNLRGMFAAKLSPSGNLPATHRVSSGWLTQAEVDWLDANLPKAYQKSNGTFNNGTTTEPESPAQMFSRLGLKPIQGALA